MRYRIHQLLRTVDLRYIVCNNSRQPYLKRCHFPDYFLIVENNIRTAVSYNFIILKKIRFFLELVKIQYMILL